MKECTRCNVTKTEDNYYVKSYGLQSWCKECCGIYRKEYERINRERIRPQKYKRSLEREYGLSYEDYLSLLEKQRERCAICNEIKPLCVDHDHETGKIRGLLCGSCNRGLGSFQDNEMWLVNAAEYLGWECR